VVLLTVTTKVKGKEKHAYVEKCGKPGSFM
jgi:hypothetical protein